MIKAYTIDATVTAVWSTDPAFDMEHTVDPGSLRDEWREMIDQLRERAPGVLPGDGPVLAFLVYNVIAPTDPGAWRELLKVRDGQRPTRFVLGAIPASELNRIEHDYEGDPRHYECFRASVRDIIDGPHDTVDAKAVVPTEQRNGYRVVRGQWIDNVFVREARRIANDIGRLAWAWNQLGDVDVKN